VQREVPIDIESEIEEQVQVVVRHIVPPFLDGRVRYTKLQDPVSVVRDPTSDIAKLAKNGSLLVSRSRRDKERSKNASKPWAIDSKSTLGIVLGVKNEDGGIFFFIFRCLSALSISSTFFFSF
jgi:pre-mRNA-splicing factor ATP-dependent RNA helicase DHX38/PRP16